MADQTAERSLYHRLGGYDAIAAIVDDLFARMQADPKFSRFAAGRSLDSHKRARQLLVDQIAELTGGPCFYIGRDMKSSHAGLAITEAEWEANLAYTRQAMSKQGVGRREQDELIAIFQRFKPEIVEPPPTPRRAP